MTRDPRSLSALAAAATILMAGCAAPPAASESQDPVPALDHVAGLWALRGPDGARCDLSLGNLVVEGGRPVLAERCAIPMVRTARTWRVMGGGFELLAADGGVVMTFRRVDEDRFEAADGFILTRSPLF